MFTLFAKLPPLRDVVGSAVKNIDLAIGTIGSHDFLLDRFADAHMLDHVVQRRLLVLPFLRWDDLDDSGRHAVTVDFVHLKYVS